MISSVKQSSAAIGVADLVGRKSSSLRPRIASVAPLSPIRSPSLSLLTRKPLYLASPEGFVFGFRDGIVSAAKPRGLAFKCEAYEADGSESVEVSHQESRSATAQKVKIGIYFATWWALNVVFNIYNKKVLNAFPYPWLTSTLSLATGSLMMLISWATRIAEAPKTDFNFWKALAPVAVAHTIGHVAATVSMSKVAVSFTHIIKSGEPAFSVLVSRFLLGETFPVPRGMKGTSVSGMNYYACLSMLSLLILTPFAIAIEGPQMWAAGWQTAISQIGPHFIWWVAAQSVFYHLYNQVSYMSLDEISPLTFSIGNTMKRISVIVSSIIIFHTPVQPINALGAAIAILGTFLYSQLRWEQLNRPSSKGGDSRDVTRSVFTYVLHICMAMQQHFIINQTVFPERIACLVHLPLHENFGTACPIVWSCRQSSDVDLFGM
ncbi:Glucose-6-phosphate phosphate translocator [Musa troglodytarum]|uniref:Glucose-6-phosphate phosphate translocator n=1 Tax=Musa troglodytarum TaxID=320322 RepID=A0A9E7F304_9LILI|nr:Glucose-6-phosphate phosphate translocator [Musa troglodytarum]